MVAKSFQSMTQIGESYTVNGKEYVQVRNEKTGTIRQVRWYTQKEYEKLYPESKENPSQSSSSQKQLLGFQKGYITIFSGDVDSNETWFRRSIARYCRHWGWYIISTEEVPKDLPSSVKPVVLPWDLVGDSTGKLKSEEQMEIAINELLSQNTDSPSEFFGNIGDRIEIAVTVNRNIPLENEYGNSNMHVMEDQDGNVFIWTTASKNWPEGSEKLIRGTVKSHRLYRGVKQTILSRCSERGTLNG